MKKPLISVILPTYNRSSLLPDAVDSILSQSYVDFELIIINDGSTDGTDAWLKNQSDRRIKVISYLNNQGPSFARNKGLDVAKGKYIAFADSDDLNEKTRFEEQVKALETDENLMISSCDIQVFGEEDSLRLYREKPLPFRVKSLFQTPMHFPACMFRKSFLEDENIRFRSEVRSADDYYFLMKTTTKGRAEVIPKALYHYRLHKMSISSQKRGEQNANELEISKLAFEEILGMKLTDEQASLIYRFYRFYQGECLLEEEILVAEMIKKIETVAQKRSNLTAPEKKKLISFLKKKHRTSFETGVIFFFIKMLRRIFRKLF